MKEQNQRQIQNQKELDERRLRQKKLVRKRKIVLSVMLLTSFLLGCVCGRYFPEIKLGKTEEVLASAQDNSDEEKKEACIAAKAAGADFVKTSTGFSTGGAEVADIKLMREVVGPEMGVKASGGIRTREKTLAMLEAGATRIGASATKAIIS